MEAIKKKIQSMKTEKDNANDKADAMDQVSKDANIRVGKNQEEVDGLKKRLAQLEVEYATAQEVYAKTLENLEAKEKKLTATELELNGLAKKVQGTEEKFETVEEKLKTANDSLILVMHSGDEAERLRKVLNDRVQQNVERIKTLEAQCKEAEGMVEEADKKCGEVAEKMTLIEMELEMEMKNMELEEELKVVGNNLKSLEVSEEKAKHTEIEFQSQIKNLSSKLKQAEARAQFAERTVQKLLKEVDRIEDELKHEEEKFRTITTELETTFSEMTGY